jgi:hypothetical protein
MATKDVFNGVVDAFLTKINLNLTTLGIGGVEERAEDPAVLDKVRKYGGYMYVIPLAEGRDRMDNMQGSPGKEMYHNFSMNVTTYFDYTAATMSDKSLISSLRKTRDYAFTLVDLFNGDDNQMGKGFVFRFELEQGYYEIVDRIIYTYNVKFFIKILEN